MRLTPFQRLRLLAGRGCALLAGAVVPWITCASGEQPLTKMAAEIQFMHYVAQYAVWPTEALKPGDRQFVLGILGENPFGNELEKYFNGKSVKSRPFAIKVCKSIKEAEGCHMLFIGSSERNNFARITKQLDDKSILTISDTDGFIQKDGMIFIFIIEKSEITGVPGWDINAQAMKKAGLQIDPFFLERARKLIR